MKNIENIKLLPKVEVSFQDDFAGNEREIVLTPKYILNQLNQQGIEIKIGDKVLLWEKDIDLENKIWFLCEIGEITKASSAFVIDHFGLNIELEKFVTLDTTPIIIKIEKDKNFDLSEEEWRQI